MLIVEPLPAASIITPMMLLALTRRPLRDIQISLWNLPASWVSFADARACSPSLLTISTSTRGMFGSLIICLILRSTGVHCAADVAVDVDHAVAAAAHGLGDDDAQAAIAISQCANQHGQADAGHAFDFSRNQQLH